ncbi:MAG: epoxyqueuosine reductase [Clostridiales bacterium]|nr:epoxyqueuosine reductase [Clostridiales bacterium]
MPGIDEVISLLYKSGACAVGVCSSDESLYIGEGKRYKSVFCAAYPYLSGDITGGKYSKYAQGADYHQVLPLKIRSFLGEGFDVYVDVSPFREVNVGVKCGIGKRGENNLLIVPVYGSFVFLACVGTDMEYTGDPEEHSCSFEQRCSKCFECVRSCPSGALSVRDGKVEFSAELCLSHISQKRGDLTDGEKRLLRENGVIWGCDRCQDVCPENRGVKNTYIQEFRATEPIPLTEEDLQGLTNSTFKEKYKNRAFTWRGLGVLKRNIKELLRRD